MPKFLKRFRKQTVDAPSNKKEKRTSGIFRSSSKKAPVSSTSVPVEQSLTWTLSDDSEQVDVSEQLDAKQEILVKSKKLESPKQKTYTFTEEEVMQHELSRIRGLMNLQNDIENLKKTTDKLVQKHTEEIAKKDDEYVELLIVAGEREEEVNVLRTELDATKEELAKVSCELIQVQHELFEQKNKSWRSIF